MEPAAHLQVVCNHCVLEMDFSGIIQQGHALQQAHRQSVMGAEGGYAGDSRAYQCMVQWSQRVATDILTHQQPEEQKLYITGLLADIGFWSRKNKCYIYAGTVQRQVMSSVFNIALELCQNTKNSLDRNTVAAKLTPVMMQNFVLTGGRTSVATKEAFNSRSLSSMLPGFGS